MAEKDQKGQEPRANQWAKKMEEAARARRSKKVTPEELAARAEHRKKAQSLRETSAAAASARPGLNGVQKTVVVLGLLGTVGCGLAIAGSEADFEAQSATNAQRVAELRAGIAEAAPAEGVTEEELKNTVEDQLNAAREHAQRTADLQNRFAQILDGGDASPDQQGQGAPSKAFMDAVAHREKLAPMFSPDSFIVEGAYAYQPSSAVPFSDTEMDPRYPWYLKYDGEPGDAERAPAEAESYGWEVSSVRPSGTPGAFSVSWVNYDEGSGDLLAWADASYLVEEGVLSDLRTGTTSVGTTASLAAPMAPDEREAPEGPDGGANGDTSENESGE